MLDQDGAVLLGAVLEVVGLLLANQAVGVQDALVELDLGDALGWVFHDRLDFGAQVDGVGEQPFFLGLQVEDAGVAGVVLAFEDGDRALHQVQRRCCS